MPSQQENRKQSSGTLTARSISKGWGPGRIWEGGVCCYILLAEFPFVGALSTNTEGKRDEYENDDLHWWCSDTNIL